MGDKNFLIAIPINEEKLYSFFNLVAGLGSLVKHTEGNVSIAFTVHSDDVQIIRAIRGSNLSYHLLAAPRRLVSIPVDHIFNKTKQEHAHMMNITLARQILREWARITGVDYLFFLDADGMVEPDAINRLMSYNMPVATCIFAQRLFVGSDPVEPESVVTHYPDNLYWNDVKDRPAPIWFAGYSFGACLIRRDILERYPITFIQDGESVKESEDYTFYRQIRADGHQFCCDQHIRTIHFLDPRKFPCGWTNDNRMMTFDEFVEGHSNQGEKHQFDAIKPSSMGGLKRKNVADFVFNTMMFLAKPLCSILRRLKTLGVGQ